MAGTRLLVHTSFLVQLTILTILAIYRTRHSSIFVDRSGLRTLSASLSEGGELPSPSKSGLLLSWLFPPDLATLDVPTKLLEDFRVNVKLHLHVSQTYLKDPEQLQMLEEQLRLDLTSKRDAAEGKTTEGGKSSRSVPTLVTVSAQTLDDRPEFASCDGTTMENVLSLVKYLDEEERRDDDGRSGSLASSYHVVTLGGCTRGRRSSSSDAVVPPSASPPVETQIEIHDSGAVLVRVFNSSEGQSQSKGIVPTGLVEAVHYMIHPPIGTIVEGRLPTLDPWYHVTTTLLDEDPGSRGGSSNLCKAADVHSMLGRDLSNAVNRHLVPTLVQRLAPLSDFSLGTRTLSYISMESTTPNKRKNNRPTKGLKLNDEDASYHEASLRSVDDLLRTTMPSSHRIPSLVDDVISPTYVEFVAYVPSADRTPLLVRGGDENKKGDDSDWLSTSVSVPGRGGVAIVNLPTQREILPGTYYDHLDVSAQSFVAQLRTFLGLSPARATAVGPETLLPEAEIVHRVPAGCGVTQWEVDALIRYWLPKKFSRVGAEMATLLTLIKDRQKLPVSQNVGDQMVQAVLHMRRSSEVAMDGRLDTAMEEINAAFLLAKALRSNGSMIEKLHVPDEHLMAIFTPLLLPLILPLVMGFIREVKRYKKLKNGEHGSENRNGGDFVAKKDE